MILSIIILGLAFAWLAVETDWLRIRLPYGSSPDENHEHIKRHPRIDTGEVKECAYPETKLLAQYCELTAFQNKVKVEKWRYNPSYHNYDWNDPRKHDSYQQTIIGGHMVILNATSPKLYDTIAEVQKTADSKPRKLVAKVAPLPKFITMVEDGEHETTMKWIGNDGKEYESKPYKVKDYKPEFETCLIPKEWLEAHYNDHKDFEPTIELTVNEKSISFNGDYRTGKIHDFCVLNAELWERPRIKGKKLKVEAN